jgi:N-acetylglucosamine kinase-like BadF-type ATPase
MKLIADSGSTKTAWAVVENPMHVIKTDGINPIFMDSDAIENTLRNQLLPHLSQTITEVYFYGAGCANEEKNNVVKRAIQRVFGDIKIEIASDLLGAARGLCGHQDGIACILGTGSNSCLYKNGNISWNVPALGFILGDEGSGAVLGKLLMGNLFKNQLPDVVKTDFEQTYGLSMMDVIEKVYRQPLPNRFLASFGPFISKHIAVPQVYNMVYDALESFIVRNIKQYPYQELPVNFTGSIAFYFADILHDLASKHLFSIGCIQKDPLQGLVEFHLKDN